MYINQNMQVDIDELSNLQYQMLTTHVRKRQNYLFCSLGCENFS